MSIDEITLFVKNEKKKTGDPDTNNKNIQPR